MADSRPRPTAAVEQAVLHLPALQVDPYRGMTPHFRVSAARARALHGAISGSARIIVASAAAMLPRMSPPERMRAASIELRVGSEIEPLQLAELLVGGGFTREDPVDEHGAFAVRGGIVDVFPATGRRAGTRRVRRRHGRDDPPFRSCDTTIDRADRSGSTRALRASDSTTASRWSRSSISCPLHRAGCTGSSPSWTSFVSRRSNSATNCKAAIRRHKGGGTSLRCRPKRRSWIGTRSPCVRPPAPRLEELAVEDSGVHQVSCQPAMEFRSRIADWVADIRRARERGATVIVVTGSAGRAERTVEILHDYDIVAIPVERSEDAHSAAVLVARGNLSKGFLLEDAGLQVYAETDVFEEERRAPEQAPEPCQDVPLRPSRSEGRRSRCPRRSRHR